MRYDTESWLCPVPLKWLTYGYICFTERRCFYFWLRLPSLTFDYCLSTDCYEWRQLSVLWINAPGFGLIGRWRMPLLSTVLASTPSSAARYRDLLGKLFRRLAWRWPPCA